MASAVEERRYPMTNSIDKAIGALRQAIPHPVRSVTYEHERLGRIIDREPGTRDYYRIIAAWRDTVLAEEHLRIDPVRGVGYRVLDDWEVLAAGIGDLMRHARAMRRVVRLAGSVDGSKLSAAHREMRAATLNNARVWLERSMMLAEASGRALQNELAQIRQHGVILPFRTSPG